MITRDRIEKFLESILTSLDTFVGTKKFSTWPILNSSSTLLISGYVVRSRAPHIQELVHILNRALHHFGGLQPILPLVSKGKIKNGVNIAASLDKEAKGKYPGHHLPPSPM